MPTRYGIKSCHSELSQLCNEELSREPVKHCVQGLCGGGAYSISNTNRCGSSDSVKESNIVSSVQNSPNNTIKEVGFDD